MVDVWVAEPSDTAIAIECELRAAGVSTIEELAQQARTGEFTSERARRAWFMVAPIRFVD